MIFNFLILTKKELLYTLASFLAGFILGIVILNLIVSKELDQLIYERKELITEIENQKTQLENLEESLAEEKKKVIQKLKIRIETELEKHIKQELEKEIFQILNSLIGRDIGKIDGSLIAETIDERIVIIQKKRYKLKLIWLIIQPEVKVSFEIDKIG